jgi:hypothetical protein
MSHVTYALRIFIPNSSFSVGFRFSVRARASDSEVVLLAPRRLLL